MASCRGRRPWCTLAVRAPRKPYLRRGASSELVQGSQPQIGTLAPGSLLPVRLRKGARPMKTKAPDEFSHYAKMTSSAQQFHKEAADCRAEAARSLNPVDREGWVKLANEQNSHSRLSGARFSGGARVDASQQSMPLAGLSPRRGLFHWRGSLVRRNNSRDVKDA
jgi:hypothetical protein